MSKYLRKYENISDYRNDASIPSDASSASLAGDEVKYDGVNVDVQGNPNFGDAVYADSENKLHFIKARTLDKDNLPSGFRPVGVVGTRHGNQIMIVYYQNQGCKYAVVYRWELTGANLTDGASHTSAVTLQGTSVGNFTYSTSTIAAWATAFNAWLTSNSVTSHHAYVSGTKLYLVFDAYSASPATTTIADITLTTSVANEMDINGQFITYYGNSNGRVWSLAAAKQYFKNDIDNASYNPSSVVSSVPSYPVCLPGYLGTSTYRASDMCAWLREQFGEGEEGWVNYLSKITIEVPLAKGIVPLEDTLTDEMKSIASEKYIDASGVQQVMYPAFDYANTCGVSGVSGVSAGDFFMIGIGRLTELMRKITYGVTGITTTTCDDLNNTLSRMGGSLVSCASNRWLPSRHSSAIAWNASNTGFVDGDGFFSTYGVLPIALYTLQSNA